MAINKLDETKAALRLLLALYRMKKPPDRMTLLEALKTNYGIERTAAYRAIATCMTLNLIRTEQKKFGKQPRASIIHYLTKKGTQVAKRIAEINEILEKDIT